MPAVIQRHHGGHREGQMRRQLARLFNIAKDARQAAGAPLGNAVQADGQERMTDEGIFKPPRDRLRKGHQILLGQRQGGDDLIIQGALHEFLNQRVLHSLQHIVIPALEGGGDKGRMRAVQDTHLALLIGALVVRKDDGQAALRQGQDVAQITRGFNDPKRKRFARNQQPVLIAKAFPDSLAVGLIPRIARHDAVNQGRRENARLVQPLLKAPA